MTEGEIIGSTAVLVNAGGEATAACLTAAIYYLLKNPKPMKRLRDEICDKITCQDDIFSGGASNLAYLDAVVEETLRIYPPTPGTFARRTSLGGNTVDGYFVPPNVCIS